MNIFLLFATLFTPENYDEFLALFIACRRGYPYRLGEPEVFHKMICLISKLGHKLNGPFIATKEEFLDTIWTKFLKQVKRDKHIMGLSGGVRFWYERSFRMALSMVTFVIERDDRRCVQPVESQLFKLRFSADTLEERGAASSMIELRKTDITSIPDPSMDTNESLANSLPAMFNAINANKRRRTH